TLTAPAFTPPLSLHDALPISIVSRCQCIPFHALNRQKSYAQGINVCDAYDAYLLSCTHCSGSQMQTISESEEYQHARYAFFETRSEEHTSELQSRFDLVCRLL